MAVSMSPSDLQAPQFNFRYDVQPMNIGEGYAAGIEQAGKGLAAGIGGALDVMNRSRAADDTLDVMKQTGILSNEQYQAIAGKSVAAKEAMTGMYANQWIQQQAAQRGLQQIGYSGAVDVAKQLSLLQEYQKRGFVPPGIDPRKTLAQPGLTTQSDQTSQPVTAPLIGPSGPLPLPSGVTPQIAQQAGQLAGTAAAPQPLGSGNITSPGPKIGAPIARTDKITVPGSTLVVGTGPKGETKQFVKYPDGTLREIQG